MPYTAEISLSNPTCFLFLIDQSHNMSGPANGVRKADALADAINRLLQELVLRCDRGDHIGDYFYIGLIGYGATGAGPAFTGTLTGRELVPISEIGNGAAPRTRWLEPVTGGEAPMCAVLSEAHRLVSQWLSRHGDCFPPVVMNITGGESTDGNPLPDMLNLTNLTSADGAVLLFNVHIAGSPKAAPVAFPDSAFKLDNRFSKTLFEGASVLPPYMRSVAKVRHGLGLSADARGLVWKGDIVLAGRALDIGTRPGNLRLAAAGE